MAFPSRLQRSINVTGWQFWIDRGGTFTDIVAKAPDGALSTIKLLSENPERYRDAATAGIRLALGIPMQAPIPQNLIDEVKIGTTVATNALLERKGAPTLLLVNTGFKDLLRIGHQTRPRLFDLNVRLPSVLCQAVEEIDGRVSAAGETLTALDEPRVRELLSRYRAAGLQACAIALIHAWKYPQTELRLAELARAAGFLQVSVSHEVNPLVGYVARASTTVVDAYLSPVLRHYIDQLVSELRGAPLFFMKSSGGLALAADFQGKDAILSGPAGGVVGAARTAEAAGEKRIISFDMGGTSTDVALYAGALERTFDTEVAGVEMRAPMMAIETVAAGGGSILQFDGTRFRVGPESAGANPGPAAYRRGGPLTVTDANIMCGKIAPPHFPALFGPEGNEPLDFAVVSRGFSTIAMQAGNADPRETAEGFLKIAVANMAAAIKRVALEHGQNVEDFTLQCFGGAGGQHACLVAEELGMKRVLIDPFAGVLSAYGIGLADQSATRQCGIEQRLNEKDQTALLEVIDRLATDAIEALTSGMADSQIRTIVTVHLRYEGTDTPLAVPFATIEAMRQAFEAAHQARFGFATPERGLIVEDVIVEAIKPGEAINREPPIHSGEIAPIDQVEIWTRGRTWSAPVYDRGQINPGDRFDGPVLIREAIATTVVEPDWVAEALPNGAFLLKRVAAVDRSLGISAAPDPVLLELFNNLFMGVAEQMGAVLENTSTSVNIRERLDFSCALFDAAGALVANAPHVPVHLGAMGESVRTVIAQRGNQLRPGDSVLLNNPFNGGTHLPDVTLVTPVFDEQGESIRFFVANRGHHADIGGTTPGSMPPDSRRLVEEGIVIDNFLIVDRGKFQEAAFRELLASGPFPARSPNVNIADVRAQLAANATGARELHDLVARYGWPCVAAYLGHVMNNAEESVRRVISRLGDGSFEYTMDDGAKLKVSVRVNRERREAVVDFSGTSSQRDGNFNAPPAVTHAATLYVFRCLTGDDLPLNEGCLRPLKIVIPKGSFLSPDPGRAVVAGNTEVSQATCNALLGALKAAASAQATMNNFLFGNERYQYYETICGGMGAGPGYDGAGPVHTHMTNTRITDPEILELRYPVRLERFGVREGSGGKGRWIGGSGAIRKVRALEPMVATLVGSRRSVPPFGLEGGGAGAPGRQWVERQDGSVQILSGTAQVELGSGDMVVIETPGGGGFGDSRG
jgi:5-oxoprolinase (ATP-hydrolysing)